MDGNVVGSTSSVAYGHTVGKVLAFAYIKPEAATPGQNLEVVVMGQPARPLCWVNLLMTLSERPRTDG